MIAQAPLPPANALLPAHEAPLVTAGRDLRQGWPARLLRGRAARRLVRHSTRPVVVVPVSWQPPPADAPVVALIDRMNRPAGPLRYAFETARRTQRHVRIVQADTPYETAADLDEHRERLSWILEGWRAWYPGVRVQTTVLTGDPVDVASLSERGAERLVISQSVGSRHLWSRASTALAIARRARCPVVVVPEGFDG